MGRRRGKRFLVLWLAAAITFAGCGMTTEQRDYTIYGAVTGAAIGGGIGGGVFAADNSDNWPAIPAGIVGGAIIGGIIGYLMTPPPPPPPPPPTSAATTSAATTSATTGKDHPAWRSL